MKDAFIKLVWVESLSLIYLPFLLLFVFPFPRGVRIAVPRSAVCCVWTLGLAGVVHAWVGQIVLICDVS